MNGFGVLAWTEHDYRRLSIFGSAILARYRGLVGSAQAITVVLRISYPLGRGIQKHRFRERDRRGQIWEL